MPFATNLVRGSTGEDDLFNELNRLIEKVEIAKDPNEMVNDDEIFEIEEIIQRQKQQLLDEYQNLVNKCKDVPLEKLVLTHEGNLLFEELCLRIDLNQQYTSCLPQWKDVAGLLEVDDLKIKWVQSCVRPAESLTRAILEIYMKDGGTLGEVLEALLQLECLEILEKVKSKVWTYLNNKTNLSDDSNFYADKRKFFSILATLSSVFGKDDPCSIVQKYANGLCRPNIINSGGSNEIITHNVLVQGSGQGMNSCDPNPYPGYEPDLSELKMNRSFEKSNNNGGGDFCRIMLLFADDGIAYAEQICSMYQGFEYEGRKVEFFRLNESSLWYEVLINPEACCMKWANEVDYAMPILTPKYLTEIHSGKAEDNEPLLPTSPVLNRFMYTLLRARYADIGCRNEIVRPVLPTEHGHLSQNAALKRDPLLRLVWVELSEERLTNRIQSLLSHKK